MTAPNRMTPVQSGTHRGIDWAIVAAPLPAGNGYVRIPDDHPLRKHVATEDLDLDAPGGLTYFGEDGWIGFDTLHWGDWWSDAELDRLVPRGRLWREPYDDAPGLKLEAENGGTKWTLELLVEAVKNLADQVADAAKVSAGA